MQIDEKTLTTILGKHFDAIMGEFGQVKEELIKLRGDIQQEKTASRAGKKRDWRIIKMLKVRR